MATRKKTTNLPAKRGTTAVTNWEEDMAREAQVASEAASHLATGNFLSTRGAKFSLGGNEIGAEIDVVIVDYIRENTYYVDGFDPDNPSSPACYAFARTEDAEQMAPHPDVEEPQNETCKGCENSAWGSADRGRGKACAERWRLGLVAMENGALPDDLTSAEVKFLRISPTQGKAFVTYMKGLLAVGKPLYTVVTRLSVRSDDKTMIAMSFRTVDRAATDQTSYNALKLKHDAVAKEIAFPYAKIEPQKERPDPRKRTFARGKGRRAARRR